jgi:hypothetical protein
MERSSSLNPTQNQINAKSQNMDTRPSTDYHPQPIKDLNQSTDPSTIDLTESTLMAAARKETGLERFGDQSFLPGLRALLKSLDDDAHLNAAGRMHAQAEITGSLKNRLWANACFEAHPEILQRKIEAPIVIVGPIRSGTTRIQRLLAADARLQHLKAWEGFNPAPRIGQADLGRQARHDEVAQFLQIGLAINPGAFSAHPMGADEADEEILLLNHSFCGLSPSLMFTVPGFDRWRLLHDKTDVYRYTANLLKLVSWSRGDPESKRWTLKTPQHMLDLDVLMKVFPDAKVVFTHRDPVKTVASTMSLAWNFSVLNTDRPLRAAIRDTWLGLCEQMARRCIAAREAIAPTQQLDIYYDDVSRDWRSVMKRVYAFAGMDLTMDEERSMEAWLAASEKENRHGAHRYSLDDYGITADEIDARMLFYRERYAIPVEGG